MEKMSSSFSKSNISSNGRKRDGVELPHSDNQGEDYERFPDIELEFVSPFGYGSSTPRAMKATLLMGMPPFLHHEKNFLSYDLIYWTRNQRFDRLLSRVAETDDDIFHRVIVSGVNKIEDYRMRKELQGKKISKKRSEDILRKVEQDFVLYMRDLFKKFYIKDMLIEAGFESIDQEYYEYVYDNIVKLRRKNSDIYNSTYDCVPASQRKSCGLPPSKSFYELSRDQQKIALKLMSYVEGYFASAYVLQDTIGHKGMETYMDTLEDLYYRNKRLFHLSTIYTNSDSRLNGLENNIFYKFITDNSPGEFSKRVTLKNFPLIHVPGSIESLYEKYSKDIAVKGKDAHEKTTTFYFSLKDCARILRVQRQGKLQKIASYPLEYELKNYRSAFSKEQKQALEPFISYLLKLADRYVDFLDSDMFDFNQRFLLHKDADSLLLKKVGMISSYIDDVQDRLIKIISSSQGKNQGVRFVYNQICALEKLSHFFEENPTSRTDLYGVREYIDSTEDLLKFDKSCENVSRIPPEYFTVSLRDLQSVYEEFCQEMGDLMGRNFTDRDYLPYRERFSRLCNVRK